MRGSEEHNDYCEIRNHPRDFPFPWTVYYRYPGDLGIGSVVTCCATLWGARRAARMHLDEKRPSNPRPLGPVVEEIR